MTEKNSKKPMVVNSHDIHLDSDYIKWIHDIKKRFRGAQINSAIKVNSEQLLFNWQLGRDLVLRMVEEKWGSGIVEQLSLDLKNEFSDTKGFSTTNLWYMKKWYQFYNNVDDKEKLQRAVGEMELRSVSVSFVCRQETFSIFSIPNGRLRFGFQQLLQGTLETFYAADIVFSNHLS